MIRINQIHLDPEVNSDFKSYLGDNGEQLNYLEDVSPINVFVGANNSGKSRFMRSLATGKLRYESPDVPLKDFETRFADIFELFGNATEQTLIHSIGDFTVSDIKKRRPKEKSFIFGFLPFLADQDLVGKLVEWLKNHNSGYVLQRSIQENALSRGRTLVEKIESLEQLGILNTPKNLYIPILRGLRLLKFPSEEQVRDRYGSRTQLDYFENKNVPAPQIFTGQVFFDDLRNQLLGRLGQRQAIQRYQDFLRDTFFGNETVELIPRIDENVVYVKVGHEAERPIHDLGDGLQSLIILTYQPWITQEQAFFFIEEPEVHLHPGMQRKLMETYSRLAKEKGHTFFLTTHSNHLLDLTADILGMSVYTFQKQIDAATLPVGSEAEAKFIVRPVDVNDSSSLNLLGVRNSSVFLVNATIWVEGITDRQYFRHYLKLYQDDLKPYRRLEEDVHFAFVEYGGSNITHWNFAEDGSSGEAIAVRFLCRNAIVIVDGDNVQDQDESAKAERHRKLKELLGDRFVKLPCQEVENLLPFRVIHNIVQDREKRPLPIDDTKFTANDYANEYLGTFIDTKMFAGTKFPLKHKYAKSPNSPSTIWHKSKFCTMASEKFDNLNLTWKDLPDSTQSIVKGIYDQLCSLCYGKSES